MYVSIRLAPRVDTASPLHQCLAAHELDPVDLRMDFAPARHLVFEKLALAIEALRSLGPWEVGDNSNRRSWRHIYA